MNKKMYLISVLLTIVLIFLGIGAKKWLPVFMEVSSPCALYTLTGWYCPGCGGTRAVLALLRGHFLESFCLHPVVLYAAVVYLWYLISNTAEFVSKGKIKIAMKPRVLYLWIGLGIILVQCLLKNIFLR